MKGTDTVIKSGLTQNVNTLLQCISAMKQYEDKSLEVRSTIHNTQYTSVLCVYYVECIYI